MKEFRENLKARFIAELIIGIVTFTVLLLLGDKGFAMFALIALLVIFRKKKMDEREYQLFYKTGHFTAFGVFLAMIFIYYFLPSIDWLLALVSIFLFFHGLSGAIIFTLE